MSGFPHPLPAGAAGGDLSGTFPDPNVNTVLGGKVPAVQAASAVYYVDPVNGSDTNTGKSEGTAFATLAHAMGSNRIIHLLPGVHSVSTEINVSYSNLAIRGAGPGVTTLQAAPSLTGTLLSIYNFADLDLSGFTLDMNYTATTKNATATNQVGIQLASYSTGSATRVRLSDMRIINGWHYGLYVTGPTSTGGLSDVEVGADVEISACGQAATASDAAAYFSVVSGVRFRGRIVNNNGLGAALDFNGCTGIDLLDPICSSNAGQGCAFAGSSASPSSDLRVVGGQFDDNEGTYGLIFSEYVSHFSAVGGRCNNNAESGLGVDLTVAADTLYPAYAIIGDWEASGNTAGHGIYLNNVTNVVATVIVAQGNGEAGIGAVIADCVLGDLDVSGNTGYGLNLYVGTGVATGGNMIGLIAGTGNTAGLVSDSGSTASNYVTTSTTPPTI